MLRHSECNQRMSDDKDGDEPFLSSRTCSPPPPPAPPSAFDLEAEGEEFICDRDMRVREKDFFNIRFDDLTLCII